MKKAIKAALVAAVIGVSVATAAPAFATIVNVGGGTWNYGTSYSFPVNKNVWSHYVHNSKYHSATAIGGSNNVKVFANSTFWANADTVCGAAESAAEYWATY
jgi:lactococcin 972 family bacteriocin